MNKIKFAIPSINRLFYLYFSYQHEISLLRKLEYERLESLCLTGRVLDYGGGKKSNYSNLVSKVFLKLSDVTYESVNIDKSLNPTYLLSDENQKLPVEDSTYNYVVSFNTFEHIYDLSSVFCEINRVLMKTGKCVFIVPFIFRVHGCPSDYSRYTPSFWKRFLNNYNFNSIDMEIISWGPFSTGTVVSGIPGPFKSMRLFLSLLIDWLYYFIKFRGAKTVFVDENDPAFSAPLAYMITVTK